MTFTNKFQPLAYKIYSPNFSAIVSKRVLSHQINCYFYWRGHRLDDLLGLSCSNGSLKLFLLLCPLIFPFIARGGGKSSSLSSARSARPNPAFSSSSYAWISPSLSPRPYPLLPMLILCGSLLRRACILRLVDRLERGSVAMPSVPDTILFPSGSVLETLSK